MTSSLADDARAAVQTTLDDAVARGVTPGAVALVAAEGLAGPRFVWSSGRLTWDDDSPAADADTIYDLASLTKLLSTTILAAAAVQAKRLDLDEAPWANWPGVRVRDALAHCGGLVAWRPFFEAVDEAGLSGTQRGAEAVVKAALATRPESKPGAKTVYSDVGFIALGRLLEERLGHPLHALFDEFSRAHFAGPRHERSGLRYVPLWSEGYHPAQTRVAPTEDCPWRGRSIRGQVHDDNCFAMGGVAGHAGLFGSALDVEAAARWLLQALRDPQDDVQRELQSFSRAPSERPLGFDIATEGGSTGGALGLRAVGHLGFTGTSLWLDPEGGGALYLLLTNRVHPNRSGTAIRELRPEFHRAARQWLDASRLLRADA